MQQQSVRLADAAATKRLGLQLALRWLKWQGPKPVLLLEGNLGAGKTCLVQGMALGLEIDEPITSPTFSLSQHYRGKAGYLAHLDLYRLVLPSSADEIFFQEEEEANNLDAMIAIEWPERLSFKPRNSWLISLRILELDRPEIGREAIIDHYFCKNVRISDSSG